jgi:hypothetical protein
MKSISMRCLLALALALSLVSCGGGKATFTINGTVTGLEYPGLVLTSNGQDVTVNPVKAADGTFGTASYTFPNTIEYGDEYALTIKTQPPHEFCQASDAYDNDTAGRFASINIPIACGLQSHTIGGTISGLTVDGLVLINGTSGGTYTATVASITASAGVFTFAQPVTYGQTYGVTVLTNPTGLSCAVENGSGTMGDKNVGGTDGEPGIVVTCKPAA